MLEDMCQYLDNDGLSRIPSKDCFQVTFRFALIPAKFHGRPDEAAHTEEREVRVAISGPARRSTKFDGKPLSDHDKMALLYWHAVKAMEAGEDSVEIDADYAAAHAVDPTKIVYPPTAAFSVAQIAKMGFHA